MEPNEGEPYIQTTSFRLRVPEVITMTNYDRLPNRSVAFSRRNLFKRDHFTCQYCGCRPGTEELTIDHVTPRSHGGVTSWINCVVACIGCNARKADRTPGQARMPIKNCPHNPHAVRSMPSGEWSTFVSEAYWTVELDS